MKSLTINQNEEGQTIYKFVKKYLEGAPLSFIEKLFRIKDIKVNKIRVDKSYIIKKDDLVEIYISDTQFDDFQIVKGEVKLKQMPNVVYEDENILIVNKPSGLLVHGDKNEKRLTLTNMVLSYLNSKGEYEFNESSFTPSLAHRIDRNTSGLVIFGKNVKSLQSLEDIFKNHTKIHKYYYALVDGFPNKEGIIDKPLLKDEENSIVKVSSKGKTAITKYSLVEQYSYCALMNINILTGRTHQIRVHFASINHPLLGDSKYGNFKVNRRFEQEFSYQGQFLHAYKLSFDKIDGFLSYLSNKTFECPFNKKQNEILSKLKEQVRK